MVIVSARARIHGSNQHDVGRIFHAKFGTADGNFPIFKRLSQYFQYCPAEFWEFV